MRIPKDIKIGSENLLTKSSQTITRDKFEKLKGLYITLFLRN